LFLFKQDCFNPRGQRRRFVRARLAPLLWGINWRRSGGKMRVARVRPDEIQNAAKGCKAGGGRCMFPSTITPGNESTYGNSIAQTATALLVTLDWRSQRIVPCASSASSATRCLRIVVSSVQWPIVIRARHLSRFCYSSTHVTDFHVGCRLPFAQASTQHLGESFTGTMAGFTILPWPQDEVVMIGRHVCCDAIR